MGGVVSSPIDATTKREIQEAIKKILGKFSKEYVVQYVLALVDKVKREVQDKPIGWKLDERPESKADKKCGWLNKEGGMMSKKFTRRYFIVRHDYMVDYFEKEEDAKKEKPKPRATLSLCGYSVNPDANDTTVKRLKELAEKMGANFDSLPKPKEYPKGTIELHHPRRPNYYITIEDDAERKEWVEHFQNCSRFCYGLKNKDPVHKKAFDDAARKTRWSSGLYGFWLYGGSEEQILSDLVNEYLDWKVLGRVFGKLPGPWSVKNTMRNQINKALNKIIYGAVVPAWKAMSTAVEALRPKVEPKIKDNLTPLFKLEEEIIDKIKSAAMSIIDPILHEHVTPHLSKIFKIIEAPIVEAFDTIEKQFDEHISKFDYKGNNDESKKSFLDLDSIPSSYHMWSAYEKIDPLYDPLWALRDVFPDIAPWDLIWNTRNNLSKKMDNAIYTYQKRITEQSDGEGKGVEPKVLSEKVKTEVLQDLHFDSKKATFLEYRTVIKKIVMPPFHSKVEPACEKILSPLHDNIPDALKELADVDQMFERLLHDIIDSSIGSVLGDKE